MPVLQKYNCQLLVRKYYMDIKIIDNAVPVALREQVWDYIATLPWYIKYKQDQSIDQFVPGQIGYHHPYQNPKAVHGTMMARTTFGADEHYLKAQHRPIHKLWQHINSALGNEFAITGYPEGMAHEDRNSNGARTAVPGLAPGWRVYTNAQYNETIKHSHGIHRDTPDVSDATTRTILYVANLEWYPSWFAECVYYSDQPTGDQQQFQSADTETQRRNFNLGWAEQIVSPVPGRIISYDGRTLHTTRPAAVWATTPRITIAFRARLK